MVVAVVVVESPQLLYGVAVQGPWEEYHHDRQLRHPLALVGQPGLHPHSSSGDIGSECTAAQGNMTQLTLALHAHMAHAHMLP